MSKNKISKEHIQDCIAERKFHIFPDTTLTLCVLTLKNGYIVTGESNCVDPANFNKEVGEQIAYDKAVEKIWSLEGYLLKQKLHDEPKGYRERITQELTELDDKCVKLSNFLNDSKTMLEQGVSYAQYSAMMVQLEAMNEYQNALLQRLATIDQ